MSYIRKVSTNVTTCNGQLFRDRYKSTLVDAAYEIIVLEDQSIGRTWIIGKMKSVLWVSPYSCISESRHWEQITPCIVGKSPSLFVDFPRVPGCFSGTKNLRPQPPQNGGLRSVSCPHCSKRRRLRLRSGFQLRADRYSGSAGKLT